MIKDNSGVVIKSGNVRIGQTVTLDIAQAKRKIENGAILWAEMEVVGGLNFEAQANFHYSEFVTYPLHLVAQGTTHINVLALDV